MKTTVSTKYQIVIPKAIRRQLGIRPGQKMQVELTKAGTLTVSKSPDFSYRSLVGTVKTTGHDPVARIRKARDNWR